MAEERYIIYTLPTTKETKDFPRPIAGDENGHCYYNYNCNECKEGITRTEAIEKIAKAEFSLMWQNKYSWENVEDEDKKSFYKSAEVALNALLEGK